MRAYTCGITKEQFVAETKAHRDADRFLRGTYGEFDNEGKFLGCAVGCAIDSINKIKGTSLETNEHSEYETHLGIPKWIAKLEDTLFENIPKERMKNWPVEFAEAINEGSDLETIRVPYIVYLMEENLKSIRSCEYDKEKYPQVKAAIDQTEAAILQMIEAQKSGDKTLIESAARSAKSAAWSAWSAEYAEYAARSARSAWSARSAEYAARSARSAAESAAKSAAWSAWSAEYAEYAARSARSAAESAAFNRHADKLLELMRGCK